MTVYELIRQLSEYDANTEVMLGEYIPFDGYMKYVEIEYVNEQVTKQGEMVVAIC